MNPIKKKQGPLGLFVIVGPVSPPPCRWALKSEGRWTGAGPRDVLPLSRCA
jgi:hypothetical protein